jgi:membrane associated rhomboid family serine protease
MTPWARRLLIANVAVFFGTTLLLPPPVVDQFVLIPGLIAIRPWTLITYQFLHAGVMHLLFNMLGLYFFGPRLEARIGSRHFLLLYLVSGAVGALLSIFTPDARIVGASGAVFGVLLGFARYWPRERIYIYALIPVEARFLVVFLAALSLWSGFTGGDGIAHFAHLGGFVGGWIYLRLLERSSPARKFKRQVETAMVGGARPSAKDLERWGGVDAGTLHPVNRAEYERVLQKAREFGVPSLTIQERAFMERFVGP